MDAVEGEASALSFLKILEKTPMVISGLFVGQLCFGVVGDLVNKFRPLEESLGRDSYTSLY